MVITFDVFRFFSQKVEKYCISLVKFLQDDYDSESYDPGGRYNFKMELGRKYWKIHDGNGVHAFVDRNTGDVFKPAGWSAPAKHVRGSIFSSKTTWFSWTGPNYRL